jgi:DNA-binding MarR family transcriptional regulator
MASSRRRRSPVPEPRWLTADELEAWRAIAKLMARVPAALERQLQRDAELSYLEYYVLAQLSEQPQRTTRMRELAALTDAEQSRLSHLVGRLERRGFVRRAADPTDRRSTLATLTDAGYDHLVAAAPRHVERVRELVIDPLSPELLAAVKDAGDRIIARIDGAG